MAYTNLKNMTTPIDPKDIIDSASELLNDINQANIKFADKTNQIINSVNQSFQTVDKINKELEKTEFDALEKMDGEILDYLTKSE